MRKIFKAMTGLFAFGVLCLMVVAQHRSVATDDGVAKLAMDEAQTFFTSTYFKKGAKETDSLCRRGIKQNNFYFYCDRSGSVLLLSEYLHEHSSPGSQASFVATRKVPLD